MLSVRAATGAAFAILALIPTLARAQTAPTIVAPVGAPATDPAAPPANTSPVTMAPVTVSAGRGSSLDNLDVSTTVMTREQIQNSPETGVDQIVNRIPGVWLPNIPTGQLHPTAQPVNIRGFGTSTTINTLVMVDGVPVNDPYFRTMNWSAIPKNSVERIEVIRGGGATSLWGNMAMGGVINIITRQPEKTGASADVSYGSYNSSTAEAAASYVISDKARMGLSYNHAQSSGYNLTPAQYRNVNLVPTASKADNVAANVYLAPNESLTLFAKAYWNQAYEDGLVWQFAHNNWSTYRLLAGGSYKFSENQSLNFSGWVSGGSFGTINVANGGYTLNNTTATNQFVSQIEGAPNSDIGGSAFYEANFGPLRDVKIGIDARRTLVTDRNNLYSGVSANPTTFVVNGEHRFQGIFGQGTYRFTGIPIDVTVGVRGDFWQAMNASVLTQNSSTLNVVPNASASSFDPRIGLKFYASDELTLRAAIYRNFSAPGMNQMYRVFASGTGYTTINPNLQPMTNFGQEVGFDFVWKSFNLSGTYFNNNLNNFIDFITVCNTNPACAAPYVSAAGLSPAFTTVRQYQNVGNATFQGVELIATWQPFEQLRLTGGFTQTTAYLTSSVNPTLVRTGVQLGQVPNYMFTAGVEWRPIENLVLTAALKSFPQYWNDTNHTQLNDGATLIDLGLRWSPMKDVDVYGSIQNLTNVQYLAQGYTRTSFEGSTVNASAIPQLGMPLTATAGLRVKF
ncbi:TonB-dependent receptor [Reyranella aquatilis]|uniref:TonB-dependent receptor n=1 Tax=Reyranella aquatilis TaxID=2035356 RepID=A0ABS8KYT9_9HYPH|nr:TonB-dependent receptor [Reyranella aquatilis]MCC8431249.1 TonB-dependent receptor [Reyranella aquatilis]